MRLLFIIDPIESIKTYKDSSYAMMVEAARRGHQLAVSYVDGLAWSAGKISALTWSLVLTGDAAAWYRLDAPERVALSAFDAVLMRKDPPFDLEYLYATHLLQRAAAEGARVFNRPQALRDHSEKLAILEFSEFTPPTIVARDPALIHGFIDAEADAILKPLDGMGGSSIFRVRRDDPNRNVIVQIMTEFGARSVMAQRYLPAIRDGDKRVLLIGGEVVPYCLARIPMAGETRGNLAAGGSGRAQVVGPNELRIAERLAPLLWQRGLLLVGLDVIGEQLTEINVTSPTCFQEITAQTGFSVAGMFIDAVERACVETSL